MLTEQNGLTQFTDLEINKFYRNRKFGRLNPFLRKMYFLVKRLQGSYSYEDQIKIACMCEPPMFFLNYGLMISHAYGITLSVDEIGCDVNIGQNVTLGTNGKYMELGEHTTNHKPHIGNLVRFYSHAIVSGEIKIGDCVLVAAGAMVTKDVPSKSIVYGKNEVKPLSKHHINYLRAVLYHCEREYVKVPGLMYKNQKLFINDEYLKKREILLQNINSDDFEKNINDLF